MTSPKGTACLAGAILLVFACLAFRGINNQGLLYHDAGMNLLEAKFLDEGLDLMFSVRPEDAGRSGFWEGIKEKTTGVPPHVGKPAFNAILAAAGRLLGFHDTLSAKVTAVCSVLVVILTFLIARHLYSARSALYASSLLASSVFFLTHARSGLADPVVSFFFLAGLLFYVRDQFSTSAKTGFLTGLCCGLAFTCNQWRSAYILSLLFSLEAMRAVCEKWGMKNTFKRFSMTAAGFLLPLLLFQIPYLAASLIIGPLPFRDYWSQLAGRWRQVEGLVWFQDIFELSRGFSVIEGPFLPAVFVPALAFLTLRFFRKRRRQDLLILIFSVIPYAYFSSMKWFGEALPRTIASVIPIAAIAGGEFLSVMHSKLEHRFPRIKKVSLAAAGILVALILIQSFPRQWERAVTRSGYPEASRFLASLNQEKFMILGMEPIWRFYLGRVAYEPYDRPANLAELIETAKSQNIKYLIIDYTVIHSKYGLDFLAGLIPRAKPLAVFDNPRGNSAAHLADDFGFEKAFQIAGDPSSAHIYVYDIDALRVKPL